MQNIVRVPKKPKKTSQGGPKHCEGTKKTKKNNFPGLMEPSLLSGDRLGPMRPGKLFFVFFGTLTVFWASLTWFFWYPHNVLHANH